MKLPEVKPIILHKTKTPSAYEVLLGRKKIRESLKPENLLEF